MLVDNVNLLDPYQSRKLEVKLFEYEEILAMVYDMIKNTCRL